MIEDSIYLSSKVKKKPFILVSAVKGLYNFFVSWDSYGQPVTLNYNGSDTYQTFPGAVLSLFRRAFIIVYLVFKVMALKQNSDWTIKSQVTLATEEDLATKFNFGGETNLTIGFQFGVDSYDQLTINDTEYERFTKNIFKYGSVLQYNYKQIGLLEIEVGNGNASLPNPRGSRIPEQNFIKYDTVEPKKNNFGYYEIPFNLSLVDLQGSDQSFNPDPARYLTIIYILYWEKIGNEVFRRCRENITCANSLV
jgi:hypothetical protein